MKLELFHKMPCPFSAKVRSYIEGHGLRSQIGYRDVLKNPSDREELIRLTSDYQVPCLVIDGEPLLESDGIIAWLDSHLLAGRKAG